MNTPSPCLTCSISLLFPPESPHHTGLAHLLRANSNPRHRGAGFTLTSTPETPEQDLRSELQHCPNNQDLPRQQTSVTRDGEEANPPQRSALYPDTTTHYGTHQTGDSLPAPRHTSSGLLLKGRRAASSSRQVPARYRSFPSQQ